MSILFAIFLSMLKIGCFAFGGGYAIIALLENEFISKRNWIDHDEFLDVVAIAESTPGPVAINVATYICINCDSAVLHIGNHGIVFRPSKRGCCAEQILDF